MQNKILSRSPDEKSEIFKNHNRQKSFDAANSFNIQSKFDRIKLVNDKATGKFENGKSVPKSRPTIFWDHHQYNMPFKYNEFQAKKEERDKKHQIKIDFLHTHNNQIEEEINDLRVKIQEKDK